ncbi:MULTISPECIES: hypothetical protein [unclassified Myxococcus]|uniref:hypothetical protein n=1 Tax=unclassified Myxococcus TaxID=2648731 RepID=UPI00157B3DEE|nr:MULTISPECIES: hypothetical protein [unclassified Myxococcus]NTX06902.1 hypothetical protein [Myxococcus sp. CA040A]NTX38532.1 hypothetical protein [Myxococcus sp. CA033]
MSRTTCRLGDRGSVALMETRSPSDESLLVASDSGGALRGDELAVDSTPSLGVRAATGASSVLLSPMPERFDGPAENSEGNEVDAPAWSVAASNLTGWLAPEFTECVSSPGAISETRASLARGTPARFPDEGRSCAGEEE